MKFKSLFIFLTIGAAFLIVSLWVWLSKGSNARALKTKYRLGGILIASMAMVNLSSCRMSCYDQPMCYDTMANPNTIYSLQEMDQIHAGDTLFLYIEQPSFKRYSYRISSLGESQSSAEVIQEGLLQEGVYTDGLKTPAFLVTLNKVAYIGKAELKVFAEEKEDKTSYSQLLWTDEFSIVAPK